MIIDAHSHGFHGKYIDLLCKAGGNWAKQSLYKLLSMTSEKPQFIDVDLRINQLERCKIDLQIVTPQQTLDCNLLPGNDSDQLAMSRAINDNMIRLQEDSKGKLLAVGNIPLTAFEKGGRKEMERAVIDLGLKALSIPSNILGKPVDLPEYESFWSSCVEMDIPVYIHPCDSKGHRDRCYEADYDLMHNFGWPFETQLILSRMVFSGMMEKYPALKIVSHHIGGGIPFWWGRINETYTPGNQMRTIGKILPKPLFDYFSLFYYDTAVGGNASAIKCAYDIFGSDRIVFATDSPWGPGNGESRLVEYPKIIRSIGLSDVDNKKIFSGNAIRLLNLN